ncbi:MBL fold metallo-hydrolase [Rhodobacter veldkampii DSM 11550]|uniref:MBL fold metallo-hydrolase n=1 Tax=Phaeovulum veldkampii DSM 11550 TaxID=1185920 RepID=A0A2T4JFJ9_9RHOB|nr:MBL fold metallo-hydrolase [Phaeovulum veldkampii]MBK5945320.1 MBL fold metallo-hydrolase [Phaeovulum veldkampii DSM 11550]PTE16694.1 MBL fold metallo-hydrolase [Phaeovulum veldkampii DSM 11550]TDQ60314.1 metallo-beta-lactamase family protein [Phaeovulum veldkampii DSM 11550]
MTHPRLTFHGAARGVTGSCFRLETGAGQVLIDCGLFQGSKSEKELNYRAFPFKPEKIGAVILSHAHIDHSGLLPKLVREGFAGAIHATPATTDLCGVMLPDSAHIQEFEVEQLNRRSARRGRAAVEPIYTGADAAACLDLFRPEPYGRWFTALPGVRARFWNAGHLLGSASVEVELARPEGAPMRILVSADIGPDYKLLHPDPEAPSGIDYLICESTYGDTDREDATAERRRALLRDEVKAAINPDGVLLIPSFAVERAQELIADLSQLMAEGALPQIPIHVDSPMATKATKVFADHSRELEGGGALMRGLRSNTLHFTETVEQSMALDRVRGFHIVIAASGMCEAGRIRHRLKNWLWRDEATVLLVGYQAEGTLGRILHDGAASVRIQGEEFTVRARIRSIDLYSGHADGPELAEWIKARLPLTHDLFLVHGEPEAMAGLSARLAGIVDPAHVLTPALDESFDLTDAGAVRLAGPEAAQPRLAPEQVARLDWHNDVSALMLDINDALAAKPDEKTRDTLIRRLRRALEEGEAQTGPSGHGPGGARRH